MEIGSRIQRKVKAPAHAGLSRVVIAVQTTDDTYLKPCTGSSGWWKAMATRSGCANGRPKPAKSK